MQYSHQRYAELVNRTIDEIKRLSEQKGGEYAGDDDRLANFRRNGLDQELPMETIWRTYAGKHWDAINQYCLDIRKGKERVRAEPISGRLDDLIVYCLLMKAMVEEREGEATPEKRVPQASIDRTHAWKKEVDNIPANKYSDRTIHRSPQREEDDLANEEGA